MKQFILAIGALIVLISSCKPKVNFETSNFEKEILALESIQNKRDYLEIIFKDDQKVRDGKDSEIMLKYGKDSKEFNDYIELQIKQDDENLNKIETYIKIYGHPKQNEVGEIAAITPWAVIHHAQGYEPRERNFSVLYSAFLNGDLNYGQVSMLLGRMYEIKNGERFRMMGDYDSEDEINQLIEKLNLSTQKANVQHNL
ncbi:hypothetical protein M601_014230 [Cellulophaga baltica 4]|nr:hypothetical protein M601_014230 [Cellulophaga baltica 4]